jgi:hypothetical protein
MERTTIDRGAILHFAGAHHLSPALDGGGSPALSAESGGGLERCGWERFFAAMTARHLALAFTPDDPASARFVAAGGRSGGEHGSLAGAIEHARRFLKAMRS